MFVLPNDLSKKTRLKRGKTPVGTRTQHSNFRRQKEVGVLRVIIYFEY